MNLWGDVAEGHTCGRCGRGLLFPARDPAFCPRCDTVPTGDFMVELEQDPPLQQAGVWEWIGVVVVLVVSAAGWLAVAYGSLWTSPRVATVGAWALLVVGSTLIFYGLVRMELDELRQRRQRMRERASARRAA